MPPLRGVGIQIVTLSVITSTWLICATRGQVMTPDRIALCMALASMASVGLTLVFLPKTKP